MGIYVEPNHEQRFHTWGEKLKLQRHLKYLGVVLDDIGRYGKRVEMAKKKAEVGLDSLPKMMANITGPQSKISEVLSGEVQSNYGASVWAHAMRVAKGWRARKGQLR